MTDKEYVLVTEYFHPDTASTGQLMTDLAVGLEQRGLDMTVYTGQPNYHSGEVETQPRRETHEGVSVRRIRAPQLRQSSLPKRLFNWTTFTIWMVLVLATDRTRQRELVFVSNPPFLPPAVWLICQIKGWEYTYIVYDLYPDVIAASGHIEEDGLVYRGWSKANNFVFGDARHVIALGKIMKDQIVKAAGDSFDKEKVAIIHNWADGEFIQPREKADNWFSREHDLVDRFTVVYSGNIGANHDLETAVKAACAFRKEDICFLIIGEGDKKDDIVKLADRYELRGDTVQFLPFQDIDMLPYTLTAGDISLVAVNEGMKGLCVSSKLYTSLAAGQPLLVVSQPEDDEARIVKSHSAGFQVTQGDVQAMVHAIERWRREPELVGRQGKNAREAFEAHFSKPQSLDAYFRLLTADEQESDHSDHDGGANVERDSKPAERTRSPSPVERRRSKG